MRQLTILSSLIVAGFLCSCNDCDDCKDLQQKSILVQNANGTNLLFGDGATYDPAEVILETSSGIQQSLFIDENTETLQFFLEENETTYTLRLNETEIETLNFEVRERESERCCGTQTFSISTSLNGTMIENSDTINIVK